MDEARFKTFFVQTAKPLRSYLLGVCRNREMCDDIFQESYVRLLQSAPEKLDETKWRPYLFAAATNVLRDHWRHTRRWKITGTDQDDGAAPARFDKDLADRDAVGQALARLSPRERSLVWLAYVEGYSHKEIAVVLHIREKSVRVLLFRAKRRMAQALDRLGVRKE